MVLWSYKCCLFVHYLVNFTEKPQFLYPTRMESIKSTYKEGDQSVYTDLRGQRFPSSGSHVVQEWQDKIFYGRHRAGELIEAGKYDYLINFFGVDIADAGTYTCIVLNVYGRLTYSYNFDVTGK